MSKFGFEAQAEEGIMHPNIIDVCDAGEKSGFYFLIHEVEAMADNQKHQKIEIIDNFIGNVELSTEEYKGEAAPLDILLMVLHLVRRTGIRV